jgi:primosomal protein N' (replication factor Y) (superfamily II helicase)
VEPSIRWALVAVARPLRGEFTYVAPPSLLPMLVAGQRVRVPFGRSTALGFFLAFTETPPPEVAKARAIESVLDEAPALPADVVELARFAAQHYRYPLGEVLKGALPPALGQAEAAVEAKRQTLTWVSLRPDAPPVSPRAHAQQAIVGYLQAIGGRVVVDELAHAIEGARPLLKKLAQAGVVLLETEVLEATVQPGLAAARHDRLTDDQQAAVTVLKTAFDAGGFAPVLLHGVTGSGKTEVYLQLVEHAQAANLGALVLVPEIALTPQLVGRFRSRFGPRVAVLHSGLSPRERQVHWQALRKGEVSVAVGVRSAIFAPVPNLGLLVVDEEHEPSFKQDDKLRYHARDLAVVRAKQLGCLVILGSATPSLETLENARRGRYQLVELPRRVQGRPMPTIELVDLRVERPRTPENRGTELPVLSNTLRQRLGETLERGQQAILFLNRRGHATLIVCEVCGESVKCINCDVCLTQHLSSRRLVCHYCGYNVATPSKCTSCQGPLVFLGLGTERVEAEVAAAFPRARVARLDRDAASTNDRLTDILAAFARRDIDVLVGTQMVAKGHDFPGVTLVCVLLADSALAMPDFRAAERTFHLLTQVAGRAGRGADAGHVVVQTYNPDSAPIAAMLRADFEGFSTHELQRRQKLAWPPTTRLASLRIEGPQGWAVERAAKAIGNAMARALPPSRHGVRLLGPVPAPISRIKGQTRWQLILIGPSHALLEKPLVAAEAVAQDFAGGLRLIVDVDPSAVL